MNEDKFEQLISSPAKMYTPKERQFLFEVIPLKFADLSEEQKRKLQTLWGKYFQ